MHEVLENISKSAKVLTDESQPSDELGRLTDAMASTLRDTGLVRLLQPVEFGGYEAHPNDFLEAVMAVGVASPSAGWVAGVVGVHPWEIALMDPRLQEEIWGGARHLDRVAVRAVRAGPPRRRRLPLHRPVALLHRDRPRAVGDPRRLRLDDQGEVGRRRTCATS